MYQNEREDADNILFLYSPTYMISTLSEVQMTAEFVEELQTNSKTIWFLQPSPLYPH